MLLQDLPAEQMRPPPAGELLYGRPRFWTTFHDMLVDVYTVSIGPEKRAFQIALWLAIFNQVRVITGDGTAVMSTAVYARCARDVGKPARVIVYFRHDLVVATGGDLRRCL